MTEKFIAVVTTGGTIMCEKQPDSDKVTPKMTGLELLDNIEGLTDRFNIKLVEHSNMPGSDLSPNTAFKLKETIVSLIDDPSIMGIVVTQGTDAMDEIPYLILVPTRPFPNSRYFRSRRRLVSRASEYVPILPRRCFFPCKKIGRAHV